MRYFYIIANHSMQLVLLDSRNHNRKCWATELLNIWLKKLPLSELRSLITVVFHHISRSIEETAVVRRDHSPTTTPSISAGLQNLSKIRSSSSSKVNLLNYESQTHARNFCCNQTLTRWLPGNCFSSYLPSNGIHFLPQVLVGIYVGQKHTSTSFVWAEWLNLTEHELPNL